MTLTPGELTAVLTSQKCWCQASHTIRARLGRVPTVPECTPCEGRGFRSQRSLAQESLAHLCLHVRVCAHACVPCRSSRQPPRRDLDVLIPTGVPISWPRATFGLAASEPAQFPD